MDVTFTRRIRLICSATLLLLWPLQISAEPRKVVIIAGELDGGHPKGTHEYEKSAWLLQRYLDNSVSSDLLQTNVVLQGWPKDLAVLENADTIVVISSGSDRNELDHPLLHEKRLKLIESRMKQGCGIVVLHWSTFFPNRLQSKVLEWIGGYFDYESGPPPRNWYSKIQHVTTKARPGSADHELCRGIEPFEVREEFYYRIRFRENDKRLVPVLLADIPGEKEPQVVAWAVERSEGGRGFGFTGGHYFDNWKTEPYRRMLLNAILWTAHVAVPPQGVRVRAGAPIGALVVTGHQYPGHLWRETTPALVDSLARDPRFQIRVVEDVEFIGSDELKDYDTVILNYCNWEQPEGLSDRAKENFVRYLRGGGGLVLVHFSNGAFHFSLPNAGESDWPEFRKICRRVWDHSKDPVSGKMKSAHDPYGVFQVDIADHNHAITNGMKSFQTIDELYFNQQGSEPIKVLATAKSKLTGRNEPMAFIYDYGKGRVFQTVLGHAAESLRTEGAADLIRRGTTWTARRHQVDETELKPVVLKPLMPGTFGQALNPRVHGLEAPHDVAYYRPPFSVECFAKLESKGQFNILMAQNPKDCMDHWEIYSYARTGEFSAYLPGYEPSEVKSGTSITDNQWHHVGMTFDGAVIQLFVDGTLVRKADLVRRREGGVPGALWFGAIPPQLGCNGLIDEARISSGIRSFDQVPTAPYKPDDSTLGLWHFDELKENQTPDSSPGRNAAVPIVVRATAPATDRSHWSKDAVGFSWNEEQSRDGRLQQMDTGRFFSGTIQTPAGPTIKGMAIKLGSSGQGAVCFDSQNLCYTAAWTDGFLRHDPARYGLIRWPEIEGRVRASMKPMNAWPSHVTRYGGLYLHNQRVVLKYEVDGSTIHESPWVVGRGDVASFHRSMEIEPHDATLHSLIWQSSFPLQLVQRNGMTLGVTDTNTGVVVVALKGDQQAQLRSKDDSLYIDLGTNADRTNIEIIMWAGPREKLDQFISSLLQRNPIADLDELKTPGEPLWSNIVTTRGVVGDETQAFAIDTITLPDDNPYGALIFVGGHDFFSDGTAAICTVHGDVWIVHGLDGDLRELKWRRFATGLYQALGLKIVNDTIYVLGRDQITRLHDRDANGEADYYENFNNDGKTSQGTHDYCTCLETDRAGNFYCVRARTGVEKVSRDGAKLEIVADGFRNPNGLGLGSDDILTISPQEGEWTPASNIAEVKSGGYYGYPGPRITSDRPLGYDPPLCWLPRLQDNSSGGQVWVPNGTWGPLENQMLHLSFGRCWMFLVMREVIDGVAQAGVVKLPTDFLSGAMRGRFNSKDGHLYVSGLKGWVSSAVRDGCFQRVRRTARPLNLPVGLNVFENGVKLSFSEPLDSQYAGDPGNYSVEQWNYLWSANYGSTDYKVSSPQQEGHDELDVRSVTLLDDGRSVFLELRSMKPVMQMSISMRIRTASGAALDHTIFNTIHRVPKRRIEPRQVRLAAGKPSLSPELVDRLKPGLILRINQEPRHDARISRLAAISIPRGSPPSPFLNVADSHLKWEGYLRVKLRGEYQFTVQSTGPATLTLNGKQVVSAARGSASKSDLVQLNGGFNRLELDTESNSKLGTMIRLYWKAQGFRQESVPSSFFFHDGADQEIKDRSRLRDARELIAQARCVACHRIESGGQPPIKAMPELAMDSPKLDDIGKRLKKDWLESWILSPGRLRNHTSMPRLLDEGGLGRQQAMDIVAFLTKGTSQLSRDLQQPTKDDLRNGLFMFEDLGCIGCHKFDSPRKEGMFDRVSLAFVGSKFRPTALVQFLRTPHANYKWSRMPDFGLSESEATLLAQYLLDESSRHSDEFREINDSHTSRTRLTGSTVRGRELLSSKGCVNCHEFDGLRAVARLPLDAKLAGCLATGDDNERAGPRFNFDLDQRGAIVQLLDTHSVSLSRSCDVEASSRMMTSLRCTVCHSRDAHFSRLPEVLVEYGEQGKAIDRLPDLSLTGEKLQGEWMRRFIGGSVDYRPRPWFATRMPSFPKYADSLTDGMRQEHGIDSHDSLVQLSSAKVGIGVGLTRRDGGFDCRQCHGVGQEVLQMQNKAQGISMPYMSERLRHEYYLRWMFDPIRIDQGTKMPRFCVDGETTQVKSVMDGDAEQQFDALWHFLREVRATTK